MNAFFRKNKILISILTLVFVLGIGWSIAPQIIHAQAAYNSQFGNNGGGNVTGFGVIPGVNGASAIAPAPQDEDSANTCNFGSVAHSWNMNVCMKQVVGGFFYLILMLCEMLMGFSARLLDSSISYTVVHISDNLSSISAIGQVWVVFRDLVNLSFIFILLYVSICTILQVNNVNARRTLLQIIVAAILINFSLFIAKVIIDFSNIFTLAFYNTITSVPGSTQPVLISIRFKNMLGLNDAIKGTEIVKTWSRNDWGPMMSLIIGQIVIVFVSAFSFLTAAWLFLYRYFIIIMVLMLAPLGFIGSLIPAAKNQSKRWWDALMGQALFPPIYMLFLWITVVVSSSLFAHSSGNFESALTAGAVPGSASSLDVIIRFVLLFLLLNAALALAKTQASRVGGSATKLMEFGTKRIDAARQRVRNTARAVGGYAVRETAGRAALSLDKKLSNISNKTLAGKLVGNSRIGNYIRGNTVGAVAGSKFGTSKTRKQYKEEGDKVKGKEKEIIDKQNVSNLIEGRPTVGSNAPTTVEEALDRMSNTQIIKLKTKELTKPAVLEQLDSSQFNALMNANVEDKTDQDKAEIKAARIKLLKDTTVPAATAAQKLTARRLMKNLSSNDLKRLPESLFGTPGAGVPPVGAIPNSGLIALLNPSKMKDLAEFSDATRQMIGDEIDSLNNVTPHPAHNYIHKQDNRATWFRPEQQQ